MLHNFKPIKFALLTLSGFLMSACLSTHSQDHGFTQDTASQFVTVKDTALMIGETPYRFVGVNFWYGAYLGSEGATGNIERLRAELDLLKSKGIDNLRVLGGSEDGPMEKSVRPAFRNASSDYNETLLRGLDSLLVEMGKRDMKAVIYLNNFWEWSGGMGTYLSWVNNGEFTDLGDPNKPWPAYPLATMKFYSNTAAKALYQDYVKAVVGRTNTLTGKAYTHDTAIMAWQLANEPRPGYSAAPGMADLPEFYQWIDETAGFIKSIDGNHLVSSGNEGFMGCADYDPCFNEAHKTDNIDYLTFHMWPKNWSWVDPDNMQGTIESTKLKATAYIEQHIAYANTLNKPIVLEEFGLPRDKGAITINSSTEYRDRFYAFVYDHVENSIAQNGPLVGTNVWTWGGFGRAAHQNGIWQQGDTDFTGDPPQEDQGLNSIFDTDVSTIKVLSNHAEKITK
ncbi:MAG: mannanase [Robiginitomaculum sp.]|nr:MAG: mannanase [Robiginitomaculum sp.]